MPRVAWSKVRLVHTGILEWTEISRAFQVRSFFIHGTDLKHKDQPHEKTAWFLFRLGGLIIMKGVSDT